MTKKIVIFADGTGNAFTTQESNVWRLYRALDQSQPDQISHYIPGVGTSGFRPFAMIDGATGIGVPSNVRKLYRFLCWNWDPGDEIYMFGFSRGSFTIRTLVGLLESEGLVPTQIDNTPVTHAEMQRNSEAAWRSYRAKSVPWQKSLPTIWVARWIRDLLLAAVHWRHRPYREVHAAAGAQLRLHIPIKFLGLFDTVEAFGVPIEEIRGAIDWAIWPISFRNRELSAQVEHARHALALDDERTTFHPLRFEQQGQAHRITEIWFAGVHSDLGGGYPDNSLEHVPLVWMAEEAELTTNAAGIKTQNGLRFSPGAIDAFRRRASPYGMCHDSRAGLAVFYRYSPRIITADAAVGGPPVIHYSVAEKMAFGSENYAPIVLPDTTRVLMPDGTKLPIFGFNPSLAAPRAPVPLSIDAAREMAMADNAVRELRQPDSGYVELTRDTIWWRRVAYFALLVGTIAVVSLPVTAARITDLFNATMGSLAARIGLEKYWTAYWIWVTDNEQGIRSNLNSISQTVGGFLPEYVKAWLDVLVAKPFASITVFAIFLMLYAWNSMLRDSIADRAHRSWFPIARTTTIATPASSVFLRMARFMRMSKAMQWLYRVSVRWVAPGLFLAVVLAAAVIAVSRTTVTYRAAKGVADEVFCHPSASLKEPGEGAIVVAEPFRADSLCWPSGVRLEQGEQYTVWIETTEPFFDRTIIADIAGFGSSPMQMLALPIRRWWTAEWFQPIARIGAAGIVEWPLKAVDGIQPRDFGIGKDGKPMTPSNVAVTGKMSACDPIPAQDIAAARATHEKQKVNRTLVSQFAAPASGELFLYLNDAIAALPFRKTVKCYYANNTGAARVTIEQMPLPKPSAQRP